VVDRHTVWRGIGCGNFPKRDLAGRRVEAADRVAALHRDQRMPRWSNTGVCGSDARGSGIRYSVTRPDFGSSLPKMVMHPTKPELDGTDLSSYADPTGKKVFVEFVKTVRAPGGGGFVEYRWRDRTFGGASGMPDRRTTRLRQPVGASGLDAGTPPWHAPFAGRPRHCPSSSPPFS
jgi:hypothetical protein